MADEPRDERLAELLEVEPLDELTRRRLVARALEESAPPVPERDDGRRWPLLAAAAAVLVVIVVGLGVLAAGTGGDGGDTDVAGRGSVPQREEVTTDAGTSAKGAGDQQAAEDQAAAPEARGDPGATSSSPSEADAGAALAAGDPADLGDLSGRAGRARALAAAAAVTPPATENAFLGLGERLDRACAARFRPTDLVAGLGTVDGRDAFVVVRARDDGTRRVRLVITDPCEVRQLV